MTEKRVKAKLSGICGEKDTLRLVSVLVDENVEIPYRLDLVWDVPDEPPPPHQCPGLARQDMRIIHTQRGVWIMQQIHPRSLEWIFDHEVDHGCSCCDWTVPAEREPTEQKPKAGEWISLRDVPQYQFFKMGDGRKMIRSSKVGEDVYYVSPDIGRYETMSGSTQVILLGPAGTF